jgi:hypothetical protein
MANLTEKEVLGVQKRCQTRVLMKFNNFKTLDIS